MRKEEENQAPTAAAEERPTAEPGAFPRRASALWGLGSSLCLRGSAVGVPGGASARQQGQQPRGFLPGKEPF